MELTFSGKVVGLAGCCKYNWRQAREELETLFMVGYGEKLPIIPPTQQLILLDLYLPKIGKIEFLRELRADPELGTIPVIVLTTSNEGKDKLEAYNLNVAG